MPMLPTPNPPRDAVLGPTAGWAGMASVIAGSKGRTGDRRRRAFVDDRKLRRALIDDHKFRRFGRQSEREHMNEVTHRYLAEGVVARSATALLGHISNKMPRPRYPQFFHEFITIGDQRPSILTIQIMHMAWENRL